MILVNNLDPTTRTVHQYPAHIPPPDWLRAADMHANGHTWARVKAHGLTWVEADRVACRRGVHPCSIWPDWWAWAEADQTEIDDLLDHIVDRETRRLHRLARKKTA